MMLNYELVASVDASAFDGENDVTSVDASTFEAENDVASVDASVSHHPATVSVTP
jgi:hypothetical protein